MDGLPGQTSLPLHAACHHPPSHLHPGLSSLDFMSILSTTPVLCLWSHKQAEWLPPQARPSRTSRASNASHLLSWKLQGPKQPFSMPLSLGLQKSHLSAGLPVDLENWVTFHHNIATLSRSKQVSPILNGRTDRMRRPGLQSWLAPTGCHMQGKIFFLLQTKKCPRLYMTDHRLVKLSIILIQTKVSMTNHS